MSDGLGDYLDARAHELGIPVGLARSLAGTESSGNPNAVSPKGARGMLQVMPDTMRGLGYDPAAATDHQYVDAGLEYLRQQYDRFGDWKLALAAYHAGPGAVQRAGGIPNTHDGIMGTPDYVNRIMGRAGDVRGDEPSPSMPMDVAGGGNPEDLMPFARYGVGAVDEAQPAPDKSSNVGRGWNVAMGQTMPLVKGTLGLVGATGENAFGEGGVWSGLKNWGLAGYQQGMDALKPLAKENDELTTAYTKAKAGEFGALVDWASYGLGYSLAQMVQAAGTAVVGGVAGTLTAGPAGGVAGAAAGAVEGGAVRAMAQRALAGAVAKEIEKLAATSAGKELTADALKRIAIANVAKNAGQAGALIGYAGVQEAGSIYPEAEQQAAKEGRKLDGADLARVWATSAGAAALEGLTDKLGLDVVLGKVKVPGAGGRVSRGVIGGAIGAGTEAATEGAQTFLERVGARQSLADDDALKDYINSAGLGAIGGGPVGAIGGALHGQKLTAQEKKDAADRQAQDAAKRLGEATTVEDMIGAANDIVTRPGGDVIDNTRKIALQTKLDGINEDPEHMAWEEARLQKLQEAVDTHAGLVAEQNRSTPPLANPNGVLASPMSPRVADQLATDMPGRTTATTLPDVQNTERMRLTAAQRPDNAEQLTNDARTAAGMVPSPTSLTSEPLPEQPVHWVDTTPLTDVTQARQRLSQLREDAADIGVKPTDLRLAPHPTVPGAMAIRTVPTTAPTKVIGEAKQPAVTGVSSARKQPVGEAGKLVTEDGVSTLRPNVTIGPNQPTTATTESRYRGNTRFADLTPLTRDQATERLQKLQAQARDAGNDPEALRIVAHPGNKSKFAIENQTPPGKRLSRDQRTTARDVTDTEHKRQRGQDAPGQSRLDEVKLYVEAKRKEATPAARAFVHQFDTGRITPADVWQVMARDRAYQAKRASEDRKARGESTARDMEVGRSNTSPNQVPRTDASGFTPEPKIGPNLGRTPAGKHYNPETGKFEDEPGKTPGEGTKPGEPETPDGGEKRPGQGTTLTPEQKKSLKTNENNKKLQAQVRKRDLEGVIKVLADSDSPFVKYVAEKAKALIGKTKIVPPTGMGATVLGTYFPANDTIKIAPRAETSEHTVTHEIVHALSAHLIIQGGPKAKAITKQIEKLREHVIANMKDWRKFYGLNPGRNFTHEFLAEAFSNAEFQARLAAIPYESKTAWSKFVELIGKLLGFDPKFNNALTEIITLGDRLISMGRPGGLANSDIVLGGDARVDSGTGNTQTGLSHEEALRQSDARGQTQDAAADTADGDHAQGRLASTRIRGADGLPLEVFHGGAVDIHGYDFKRLGERSANPTAYLGAWLTDTRSEATRYAGDGRVSSAYLDMRNPKRVPIEKLPSFDTPEQAIRYRKTLQRDGYDGLVIDASHLGGTIQFVAFDKGQIVHPNELTAADTRPPVGEARELSPDEADGLFSLDSDEFGADYSRLQGRDVRYPVAVQETGEQATVTTDAQQLLRAYDGRIEAMRKLMKCLG